MHANLSADLDYKRILYACKTELLSRGWETTRNKQYPSKEHDNPSHQEKTNWKQNMKCILYCIAASFGFQDYWGFFWIFLCHIIHYHLVGNWTWGLGDMFIWRSMESIFVVSWMTDQPKKVKSKKKWWQRQTNTLVKIGWWDCGPHYWWK